MPLRIERGAAILLALGVLSLAILIALAPLLGHGTGVAAQVQPGPLLRSIGSLNISPCRSEGGPRSSGIIRHALLLGCVAAAVVGMIGVGVIVATGISQAPFTAVTIVKAALGGVVAAAVTPPALRRTPGKRRDRG